MRNNSFNKLVQLLEAVEPTLNDNPPRVEEDHEVRMGVSQVEAVLRNAQVIHQILKKLPNSADLPAWAQSKLTMADDYLVSVADYMRSVVGEDAAEGMSFDEAENPPGNATDEEAPNSGGDLAGFASTNGEEP